MSRFIYFISAGTSSNDLGKSGKNNLSFFGYKQLSNLKKNKYIIQNILSQNIEILTSSDRNCVESSLILFTNSPNRTVNIVPYLSNKRDTKNNHNQLFKRNLAAGNKNKHYLETLNYGKNHIITNLIKELPIINYDLKKNGDKYYFNASKFMSLLEQKINTSPRIIVVLCNSAVIRGILKKLSRERYKQVEKESFQNSSVWEVEFKFDTTGKIIYELFSKKYPTPDTYKPLVEEGDKFLCEFKGSYIPLFEKPLSPEISKNLLNKISYLSIDNSIIKKSISKHNEEEEEEYTTSKKKSGSSFNTISNYE